MVKIRALKKTDSRSEFRSGDPDLDLFFRRYAGQNQFKHHIGTTYVAVEDDNISGFATVSACHLLIQDLPPRLKKKFPSYPLPVLRLARLAVGATSQSQGIGRSLLKSIFILAHEMADKFGCVGVVVDAKPDAVGFYEKYGFREIEVVAGKINGAFSSIPMFLPINEIPRI